MGSNRKSQDSQGEARESGGGNRRNAINGDENNTLTKEPKSKQVEIQFKIYMINIQCFTRQKLAEIESVIDNDNKIFCLTETHQKLDKLALSKGINKIENMREMKDIKGGGLMMLHRNSDNTELNKVETISKDLLYAKCKIHNNTIHILLLYLSVGNTEEDKNRDKVIKIECENIIKNINDKESLLILGDFNGHIGFLGHQNTDRNGEIILEWMNEHRLILLNAEDRCTGVYTWERMQMKSVIDFALVNEKLYKNFEEMVIDEDKNEFDISDHNLITINSTFKGQNKNLNKGKWEEVKYFKTDEDNLNDFIKKLEEILIDKDTDRITEMDSSIKEVAEDKLVRTYRRKMLVEEKVEEQPWFSEEIRKGIKERKELNRKKRNERDNVVKESLEKKYMQKKKEVQLLIREEITIYEKKITEEIRRNKNKELWENIEKRMEYENELAEEDDIIRIGDYRFPKVLREHMDPMMECKRKIIPMQEPLITKEKVIACLSKLKAKKAAGPDGIKPEFYKALMKSKTCIEVLVRCYNKELEIKEKPESWKTSRTKMIEKKRKPRAKAGPFLVH
ncbi:chromosome partition protein Smc-like [Macrobrachium nipponense]|uniref:chromosome partition protein Smc-like n=1 Tax=Macrobrachium nipponense TaxID=159736 RepID=UPI0030C872C3